MFLIVVKTILDLVVGVLIINTIVHSLYYVCSKAYRTLIYELVKYEDNPDFLDWFMVLSVFPGVVLLNILKKLLKLFKKCGTIIHNLIKPNQIKVVVYYVPKHWRRDKWEHNSRMR